MTLANFRTGSTNYASPTLKQQAEMAAQVAEKLAWIRLGDPLYGVPPGLNPADYAGRDFERRPWVDDSWPD